MVSVLTLVYIVHHSFMIIHHVYNLFYFCSSQVKNLCFSHANRTIKIYIYIQYIYIYIYIYTVYIYIYIYVYKFSHIPRVKYHSYGIHGAYEVRCFSLNPMKTQKVCTKQCSSTMILKGYEFYY